MIGEPVGTADMDRPRARGVYPHDPLGVTPLTDPLGNPIVWRCPDKPCKIGPEGSHPHSLVRACGSLDEYVLDRYGMFLSDHVVKALREVVGREVVGR